MLTTSLVPLLLLLLLLLLVFVIIFFFTFTNIIFSSRFKAADSRNSFIIRAPETTALHQGKDQRRDEMEGDGADENRDGEDHGGGFFILAELVRNEDSVARALPTA